MFNCQLYKCYFPVLHKVGFMLMVPLKFILAYIQSLIFPNSRFPCSLSFELPPNIPVQRGRRQLMQTTSFKCTNSASHVKQHKLDVITETACLVVLYYSIRLRMCVRDMDQTRLECERIGFEFHPLVSGHVWADSS